MQRKIVWHASPAAEACTPAAWNKSKGLLRAAQNCVCRVASTWLIFSPSKVACDLFKGISHRGHERSEWPAFRIKALQVFQRCRWIERPLQLYNHRLTFVLYLLTTLYAVGSLHAQPTQSFLRNYLNTVRINV